MNRTQRILLAGIGDSFAAALLDEAVSLARSRRAKVSVLQLVRIWGSGLGLPHPGLRPNRQEQTRAVETLNDALDYLIARDVVISGQIVIGTRNPAKTILRHADRLGIDLIVMAEPPRQLLSRLRWEGDAARVARRADREVRLVPTLPAA